MFKTIGFDMDGTLIDTQQLMIQKFQEYYRTTFGKPYTGKIDTTKPYASEIFSDCEKDVISAFEKWFWPWYNLNAPMRPYVKELFQKLHAMHVNIHIITARKADVCKENDPNVVESTYKWIEQNGLKPDAIHIGFYEKLSVMKGNGVEILVDDNISIADQVSAELPFMLMQTEYNKKYAGRNIWKINTFEPAVFIQMLRFIEEHQDSWKEDYELDDKKVLDPFSPESAVDTVGLNKEAFGKKNIIFSLPLGNPDAGATQLARRLAIEKKHLLIPLRLISNPAMANQYKSISPEGAGLVLSMIKKYSFGKEITKLDDTKAYVIKARIVSELLKYASEHKNRYFTFEGVEAIYPSRNILEPYKDYPVLFTGLSEGQKQMIYRSARKKNYTWYIVAEDLFEISTQLRKWRIIAGTERNGINNFINRQNTDSDGVDYVALLKDEHPYNQQLLETILSPDTYIVGDLHINAKDTAKTQMILRSINSTVSRDSDLIIIGDLDGKKGTSDEKTISAFIKKINTKKIYLILGNNDRYSIKTYVKMGFRAVTDEVVYKESAMKKVYLTHCPRKIGPNEYNVHGHIHGSKCYWNLDWHNHVDVWDENYVPVKLSDCLERLEKGLYTARTEIHTGY